MTDKEREKIEAEIRALDQLMRANDYIGIKIAMGRATKEEYAEEIAKSEAWAKRKSELQAMLNGTEEDPEGTEEESEVQPEETEEQTEEVQTEMTEENQTEETEEVTEETKEQAGE